MKAIQLNLTETITAIILLTLGLILVIALFKFYLKLNSKKCLELKGGGHEQFNPDTRVKYASVNAFEWSGMMLLLGFSYALALSIITFSCTSHSYNVEHIPFQMEELIYNIELIPPITQHHQKKVPAPSTTKSKLIIDEIPKNIIPTNSPPVLIDRFINSKDAIEIIIPKQTLVPTKLPIPKEDSDNTDIMLIADQMPRFPGCENLEISKTEKENCAKNKMLDYIYSGLKYPATARQNGIEGMVIVQFVVDQNGFIQNVKVVRDIGGGCGEAAKKVVLSMNDMNEKWTPGKQRGRPVKVLYTLPVKFVLNK